MNKDLIEKIAQTMIEADTGTTLPVGETSNGVWYLETAKDIIIDLRNAGYIVVPMEPTTKMSVAGSSVCHVTAANSAYKAMVKAGDEI